MLADRVVQDLHFFFIWVRVANTAFGIRGPVTPILEAGPDPDPRFLGLFFYYFSTQKIGRGFIVFFFFFSI